MFRSKLPLIISHPRVQVCVCLLVAVCAFVCVFLAVCVCACVCVSVCAVCLLFCWFWWVVVGWLCCVSVLHFVWVSSFDEPHRVAILTICKSNHLQL